MNSFTVIAHRGNSCSRPENTRSAFKSAIACGVDYIECDVQFTRDGHPVVFHDADLKRLTNGAHSERIQDILLEDLKAIDISSWFNPQYKDERVLTLEELLTIAPKKTGLMIEVKKDSFQGRTSAEVIAKALDRVTNTRFDPIVIGSLFSDVVLDIANATPKASIMAIPYKGEELKRFFSLPINIPYYAIEYPLADETLLTELKHAKKTVWVWTVDDLGMVKWLIRHGADGVITNIPEAVIAFRGR